MLRRNRFMWLAGMVLILVLSGGVVPLAADTYTVGSAPTINSMTSETVAVTPTPRTRTTIGIGEKVECSIDSATWADKDCNVTLGILEDDAIGDRTWDLSAGTQKANSSISGSGDSATLTASKSPGGVTVRVTIHDSHDKYDDTALVKTKAFAIVAPSSLTYEKDSDTPPWTAWSSGTVYLGASTTYVVTVNPTTVSFDNVDVRENFGAGTTHEWPDGSTWYGPIGAGASTNVNAYNHIGDLQETPLHEIIKLYTGSEWQDFGPTFPIPFEYKNHADAWIQFATATAGDNYYQSPLRAQVHVGGVTGSLQGPWQGP